MLHVPLMVGLKTVFPSSRIFIKGQPTGCRVPRILLSSLFDEKPPTTKGRHRGLPLQGLFEEHSHLEAFTEMPMTST